MKTKKIPLREQVEKLMDKEPKLSCKEIAERLGVVYQRVYPTYKAKKNNKPTTRRKTTPKKPTTSTKLNSRSKKDIKSFVIKLNGKGNTYGNLPVTIQCTGNDKRKKYEIKIVDSNVDDIMDLLSEGMLIPIDFEITNISVG